MRNYQKKEGGRIERKEALLINVTVSLKIRRFFK